MVRFLGWFNFTLIIFNFSLFFARRFNKHLLTNRSFFMRDVSRFLSSLHPITGIVVVITGIIHGYLALGSIRLHSGLILWLTIVITGILAGWGKKLRIRYWVARHRLASLLIIVSLILHLVL